MYTAQDVEFLSHVAKLFGTLSYSLRLPSDNIAQNCCAWGELYIMLLCIYSQYTVFYLETQPTDIKYCCSLKESLWSIFVNYKWEFFFAFFFFNFLQGALSKQNKKNILRIILILFLFLERRVMMIIMEIVNVVTNYSHKRWWENLAVASV